MQPLSNEETKTVDKVAEKIIQLGLQIPTLFMLDASQPLAFIGGQLLWVAQPAASLFVSSASIRRWATLLENPSTVLTLKNRLEENTK
jgi:hypothetical protein